VKVSRPWHLALFLFALVSMTVSALLTTMPLRAIMTVAAVSWALLIGGNVFPRSSANANDADEVEEHDSKPRRRPD
jgi:hypothetical protein